MPLAAGRRLGPYEIVAPLGAGGMGEVYRARDTRLGREVAIKVLPDEAAGTPDALSRFEREARAVAALAHSNVLALYDVGTDQGVAYAVTELLEGGTLRERLAAGPLTAAEAVGIARQMAAGLAAAHDKGIIHRDIKPENVFLTRDGQVKILDFGLAKRAAPVGDLSMMATATMPGTVLGTAAYMAPEQLLGQPIDERADQFGFGAVLYELLAGERAFPGATFAEVSAAILHRDPPPLAGRVPGVTPALGAIVRRTLARDPEARYAHTRALVDALANVDAVARSGSRPHAPRAVWAIAVIVVLALGAVAAWRWWPRGADAARPPVRARALAMLDFENLSGDRSLDWIGRGLPELLGTALARSSAIDVYDPQRLANLLTGSGHARDTSASIYERLRRRGLGRAVVGSILRSGSDLSIQCRVVDLETGKVLHADASRGAATDDIFRLAAGLVPKLQAWLEIDLTGASGGDAWLRELTTSSSDAYRLYLRGHEAFIASRWRESANYDEQALALDSTFIAARVDLTGSDWNLGEDARTNESLAAAKRLRPRASPREALQIDMIDAVITRDPERLIRVASSLRELYPENRFFTYLVGRGYYTAGRWNECVATLDPLVRERWTWAWTYILTGLSYEKLGRLDAARRSLETGLDVTHRNPEIVYTLADMLGRHGDTRGARALLLESARSPGLAETPDFEAGIRLALAKIYEQEGAADSARIEYQRVLAAAPDDTAQTREAREGLGRLAARH